jgi:hypothetical protein
MLFEEVTSQANWELYKEGKKKCQDEKKRFRREHPVKALIRHHREEIAKFIDAFINDNLGKNFYFFRLCLN